MNYLGWLIVCVMAVVVGGCQGVSPTRLAASQPTTQASWPANGAEGYYRWLTGCLDAIEKDMPAMTRSAEAAAKLYVTEGSEIGSYGGDPFAREIFGRSGGMMQMRSFDPKLGRPASAPAPRAAVAVVGLRDDMMDETIVQIAEFKKNGCYVVVFGRAELLDKVRAAGAKPDAVFDTHAAPHGGLVGAHGGWIIPTDSAAASAASWVWMGEFVAACTRLGKMPPMYLGYAVEGAAERETKYKGLKFHDKVPSVLEPGQLSRQFLTELRKSLCAIHESDMPQIRQAAAMARQTQADKGKLWVYLQGHVTLMLMGYPHDPQWFAPIHRNWATLVKDAKLNKGDLVLCIGFDQVFQGKDWGDFAQMARTAGARLVWSFTDYKSDQVKAVPAGEIYINQHWAKGDAAAAIPNYDIKCLPTSGVIAEAVLWMIHAEMAAANPWN